MTDDHVSPNKELAHLPAAHIALRDFPYPFRAALAICNDADSLSVAEYRRLHQFLGGEADTEWGPGLGLNMGGSFFMFRSPDSPNRFTVFDGLSSTITDDGEFILECARRGLLDVLHTYGCFTDGSHFTRRLAEVAIEALEQRGITIEAWVNHGSPTNIQCIGPLHGWQGDAVGTAGYHADLTVEHGYRWFWTGTEITDGIALDGTRPVRKSWSMRGLMSPVRGRRPQVTNLTEPYTLRDRQVVRRLYRYGGVGMLTPVLDDLPAQISSGNLEALVAAGGYAIVYQHLSVRRVREGWGTGAYGPVRDEWFGPAELSVLRELARRYRSGEISVAPTTHLLRHRDVHEALRWRAHREVERDVITVGADGVTVAGHELATADLADLTFYCERPEQTDVYLESSAGAKLIENVRHNPADHTSQASITLLPRGPTRELP